MPGEYPKAKVRGRSKGDLYLTHVNIIQSKIKKNLK
nr:MAG TPA: hypothetical protein [Crassvirales sp.]